jgi:hypothetical protein
MMLIGFMGLGYVGYRQQQKLPGAASAPEGREIAHTKKAPRENGDGSTAGQ